MNNDYNFAAPLNGKTLRHELKAALRLRYGPQTQALKQRRKDIPGWYQAYQGAVSGARTNTAGAYGQANDAITAQKASSSANDTAQNSQVTAQMQSDAALRGATVGDGAATAALASGNRQNLADAFAGLLATQGAAEKSRYDELSAIGAGDKIQSLKQVDKAFDQLRGDKGAFAVDYLHNARDDERKYLLERKGFGLDSFTAHHNAKNDEAQLLKDLGVNPLTGGALPASWDQQDMDGDGIPNGQDNYPEIPGSHPDTGSGPNAHLSPAEKRARRKESNSVWDALTDAGDAASEISTRDSDPAGMLSALTGGQYGPQKTDLLGNKTYSGKKVPGWLARAAIDYYADGDIDDPKLRKLLKRHGAQGVWRRTKPKPFTLNGPGSDAAQG